GYFHVFLPRGPPPPDRTHFTLSFFLLPPPPPKPPLFPYTTLFRSRGAEGAHRRRARRGPDGAARRRLQPLRAEGQLPRALRAPRSEEHTSELQSHLNLVCRLLLEKKK